MTLTTPAYYKQCSPIGKKILIACGLDDHDLNQECRMFIRSHGLDFNLGNAFKYLWRCGVKGDVIADLQKAKQYLIWCLEERSEYTFVNYSFVFKTIEIQVIFDKVEAMINAFESLLVQMAENLERVELQ